MKFILQIYVNRVWVVNTILHWLYNDILLRRLSTIGLFMVCFIWVTNINRMCMLRVISLDLLFLIRLRFPLDKSITYVSRSRYGNLVVKELTEIWEGWLFLTKMQVTLNISNSMSIDTAKTEIVNQIIEQINEVLEDPVEEKDSTDGLGDTIKEIF